MRHRRCAPSAPSAIVNASSSLYQVQFFQVSPAGTSGVNKAGHNAFVTALMVCCGFIICFTPFEILMIVHYAGRIVDLGSWYYHLTVVMMMSNSFINPLIYAAKYREFKQGVRSLLSKLNLNQQQTQVSAIT